MPWRTIEASSTSGASPGTPPTDSKPRRASRGAIAALGGAALLAIAAFALAFGSGTSGDVAVVGGAPLGGPSSGEPTTGAGTPRGSAGPDGSALVVVEIVGAITRPGVYELPTGSRVGDLVDAAGGYGPRVDTQRAAGSLNLASVLSDGDQIRVPSRDDPAPEIVAGTGSSGTGSGTNAPGGLVDLNRASNSELDALPGIGPVTADKIIAAREEAPFATIDDLRTRKLVGEKTFEQLKPLVTVH
jgi:competence protein ComEA